MKTYVPYLIIEESKKMNINIFYLAYCHTKDGNTFTQYQREYLKDALMSIEHAFHDHPTYEYVRNAIDSMIDGKFDLPDQLLKLSALVEGSCNKIHNFTSENVESYLDDKAKVPNKFSIDRPMKRVYRVKNSNKAMWRIGRERYTTLDEAANVAKETILETMGYIDIADDYFLKPLAVCGCYYFLGYGLETQCDDEIYFDVMHVMATVFNKASLKLSDIVDDYEIDVEYVISEKNEYGGYTFRYLIDTNTMFNLLKKVKGLTQILKRFEDAFKAAVVSLLYCVDIVCSTTYDGVLDPIVQEHVNINTFILASGVTNLDDEQFEEIHRDLKAMKTRYRFVESYQAARRMTKDDYRSEYLLELGTIVRDSSPSYIRDTVSAIDYLDRHLYKDDRLCENKPMKGVELKAKGWTVDLGIATTYCNKRNAVKYAKEYLLSGYLFTPIKSFDTISHIVYDNKIMVAYFIDGEPYFDIKHLVIEFSGDEIETDGDYDEVVVFQRNKYGGYFARQLVDYDTMIEVLTMLNRICPRRLIPHTFLEALKPYFKEPMIEPITAKQIDESMATIITPYSLLKEALLKQAFSRDLVAGVNDTNDLAYDLFRSDIRFITAASYCEKVSDDPKLIDTDKLCNILDYLHKMVSVSLTRTHEQVLSSLDNKTIEEEQLSIDQPMFDVYKDGTWWAYHKEYETKEAAIDAARQEFIDSLEYDYVDSYRTEAFIFGKSFKCVAYYIDSEPYFDIAHIICETEKARVSVDRVVRDHCDIISCAIDQANQHGGYTIRYLVDIDAAFELIKRSSKLKNIGKESIKHLKQTIIDHGKAVVRTVKDEASDEEIENSEESQDLIHEEKSESDEESHQLDYEYAISQCQLEYERQKAILELAYERDKKIIEAKYQKALSMIKH